MPGPVPAREASLARPRERKGSDQTPVTRGVAKPTTTWTADEDWHPIATMLFESLAQSGQSDFYQESDWAFAFSVCDDLSYYKSATKRSGQMLQSIMASMSNLLVTEADRRRVRIELGEDEPDHDPVSLSIVRQQKEALGIT